MKKNKFNNNLRLKPKFFISSKLNLLKNKFLSKTNKNCNNNFNKKKILKDNNKNRSKWIKSKEKWFYKKLEKSWKRKNK